MMGNRLTAITLHLPNGDQLIIRSVVSVPRMGELVTLNGLKYFVNLVCYAISPKPMVHIYLGDLTEDLDIPTIIQELE